MWKISLISYRESFYNSPNVATQITQFESSIPWFYVKWKVYCLFDRIKTLVMFDEEK